MNNQVMSDTGSEEPLVSTRFDIAFVISEGPLSPSKFHQKLCQSFL